jgi:thymidylate kinase
LQQQHIIIFGGPDGVGKTTLAKRLSLVLDIPYFKPSSQRQFAMEGGQVFREQTRWGEPKLMDFLMQTKHSAVLDRSFPCDYAYSKVLGRETAWGTIELLDQGYASMKALLVIVCSADYAQLAKDEFQKVADPEIQRKLEAAYWEYARGTNMRRIIITTKPGLVEDKLDEAIRRDTETIIHELYK